MFDDGQVDAYRLERCLHAMLNIQIREPSNSESHTSIPPQEQLPQALDSAKRCINITIFHLPSPIFVHPLRLYVLHKTLPHIIKIITNITKLLDLPPAFRLQIYSYLRGNSPLPLAKDQQLFVTRVRELYLHAPHHLSPLPNHSLHYHTTYIDRHLTTQQPHHHIYNQPIMHPPPFVLI